MKIFNLFNVIVTSMFSKSRVSCLNYVGNNIEWNFSSQMCFQVLFLDVSALNVFLETWDMTIL